MCLDMSWWGWDHAIFFSGRSSCATTEHGFSSGSCTAVVSLRRSGIHVQSSFSSPQGFDQFLFHQFEFRLSIVRDLQPLSLFSGRWVGKNDEEKWMSRLERTRIGNSAQYLSSCRNELSYMQTKKFLAERDEQCQTLNARMWGDQWCRVCILHIDTWYWIGSTCCCHGSCLRNV